MAVFMSNSVTVTVNSVDAHIGGRVGDQPEKDRVVPGD